jgi:hypothetical protein
MEQVALTMKAKRVINLLEEKSTLEEKKSKLDGTFGEEPIPADAPILAKIVNVPAKRATIVGISTSDSVRGIAETVARVVGREAELSLRIQGKAEEFNQEKLFVAIRDIAKGDASAVVIVAA